MRVVERFRVKKSTLAGVGVLAGLLAGVGVLAGLLAGMGVFAGAS